MMMELRDLLPAMWVKNCCTSPYALNNICNYGCFIIEINNF